MNLTSYSVVIISENWTTQYWSVDTVPFVCQKMLLSIGSMKTDPLGARPHVRLGCPLANQAFILNKIAKADCAILRRRGRDYGNFIKQ